MHTHTDATLETLDADAENFAKKDLATDDSASGHACRSVWKAAEPHFWNVSKPWDLPAFIAHDAKELFPIVLHPWAYPSIGYLLSCFFSFLWVRLSWLWTGCKAREALLSAGRAIKTLQVADEDEMRALCMATSLLLPDQNLFPALERAELFFERSIDVKACLAFVRAQTCSSLKIRLLHHSQKEHVDDTTLGELCCAIGTNAGGLRKLHLIMPMCLRHFSKDRFQEEGPSFCFCNEGAAEHLASLLERLPKLEEAKIACRGEGVKLIENLSALPELTSLMLTLFGFQSQAEGQKALYQLQAGAFPKLKTFGVNDLFYDLHRYSTAEVYTDGLRHDTLALLEAITSCDIEKLSLCIDDETQMREVLQLISNKWPTTLTSLSLYMRGSREHVVFEPNIFADLANFTTLEEFQLFCYPETTFDFDDKHYDVLSASLPHVRTLRIRETPSEEAQCAPKASRASLVNFATRCPNLQSLEIAINLDLPCPHGSQGTAGVGDLKSAALECHLCVSMRFWEETAADEEGTFTQKPFSQTFERK